MRLCGSVDESEDVVEDVVAAGAVGQKLEGLGVAHRSLLIVDLWDLSLVTGNVQ